MDEITQHDLDKFWANVDRNGPIPPHVPHVGNCWTWRRSCGDKGHGRVRVGSMRDGTRRLMVANRVSWIATNGSLPAGMFVLHKCDNASCVRPDHLWIGTIADNNADMRAKGRGVNPPRRVRL